MAYTERVIAARFLDGFSKDKDAAVAGLQKYYAQAPEAERRRERIPAAKPCTTISATSIDIALTARAMRGRITAKIIWTKTPPTPRRRHVDRRRQETRRARSGSHRHSCRCRSTARIPNGSLQPAPLSDRLPAALNCRTDVGPRDDGSERLATTRLSTSSGCHCTPRQISSPILRASGMSANDNVSPIMNQIANALVSYARKATSLQQQLRASVRNRERPDASSEQAPAICYSLPK